MSVEQVTVPDIGGAEDAEVIELLVAVGDKVELDQGLIVLESDKASMEIPSTAAGTIVEVLVAEGDQLAEGSPVVKVEVTGQAVAEDDVPPIQETTQQAAQPALKDVVKPVAETPAIPKRENSEPQTEVEPSPPAATSASIESDTADIYAGPAARRIAREFGVPLGQVEGTGPQGRILKEDLQQFVQKSLSGGVATTGGGAGIPAVPEIDFGKFGEIEVTQRSKVDKLTANNMHRSWLNVPHVTQIDEADITDMEAFRKGLKVEAEKRGTRITPLPFLLKACAVALRDNPRLNSSLSRGGEDLVYKKYIHIGMAVDTPAGLVVPVIRDVDRKTIWELAAEVIDLASRARNRKLSPGDLQGGCFTISSLGSIGGNGFTPIVNTPEVGILGVSKAAIKPVWNGTDFAPRTLLPVALSYDHRAVNGGDGGRFLTQLVSLLSDIRQLSL
ncbi:MAG: 2-oxo acid dehydrogenase subunit E2 [Halioglobus sp.]|nr:2-oxo acid dehydrogenase subunit E2 [Halioglobus sp.]